MRKKNNIILCTITRANKNDALHIAYFFRFLDQTQQEISCFSYSHIY